MTEAKSASFRPALIAYLREQAQPEHKYGHQPRLYDLAQQIVAVEGLTVDDDVLFAAAYLHDLGVFIGHRPEEVELLKRWDHVAYVREKAPELLREFGFPMEKLPAVIEVIEQHQPQDHPVSTEAKVLRDADLLEQLGAIGIVRTAAKLGSDTRFKRFEDLRRSLEKAQQTLPEKIMFAATRELGEPRINAMRLFLQALESEAGSHLE